MTTAITLTEWLDTYEPISNHIDPNASFQDADGVGIMFETFGEELEYVLSIEPSRIWTYMDSEENDEPIIVSGYHLASRIGHFISAHPYDGDVVVVFD